MLKSNTLKVIQVLLLTYTSFLTSRSNHKWYIDYWVIGMDYVNNKYIVTKDEIFCLGAAAVACHVISPVIASGPTLEIPVTYTYIIDYKDAY